MVKYIILINKNKIKLYLKPNLSAIIPITKQPIPYDKAKNNL